MVRRHLRRVIQHVLRLPHVVGVMVEPCYHITIIVSYHRKHGSITLTHWPDAPDQLPQKRTKIPGIETQKKHVKIFFKFEDDTIEKAT